MLQNRFMSKRIDNIFNESIATSISEPDVEIRPFDPLIEHLASPTRHLYQFSVEFFYGQIGGNYESNLLPIILKKMKTVVNNTSLETTDVYLMYDKPEMKSEFPKLYSYRWGLIIYFNMCSDDFGAFIRFINSLVHCFPKNHTIWAGVTSETKYTNYVREYSAITSFDIFGANKLISDYYKNLNNLNNWFSEQKSVKSVFDSFLRMFLFEYL